MNPFPRTLLALLACSAPALPVARAASPEPAAVSVPRAQEAAATLHLMACVADWQYRNPSKWPTTDWTSGAYYVGLSRFARIAPDSRYLERIRAAGEAEGWKLGPHKRHFADDQAIGRTWLEMHRIDGRPEQLADTLAVMRDFVARPDAEGPMAHTPENYNRRWTWCDALFMAPPLLAQLRALTGDPVWEEALLREYRRTHASLFDPEEALFYRDPTYIPKREANGQKVFWSRGNGWVFAGLADILRELPADAASRPFFEDLFKRMAARLATLQQPDGSWHASLLDPASYPVAETSGTGFFVYGFAYGLNSGLLPESLARPVVDKGWARLVSCVHPDGKLGFVQPIGKDPKLVTADMTENYGVGAFLLAGTEVWRMQVRGGRAPDAPARVHARAVPERKDDFMFESDRLLGRFYGPALAPENGNGALDAWSKNTPALIGEALYASRDYHSGKSGTGGDFFHVAGTLGAGGLGYLDASGALVPSPVYAGARILHRDADTLVFELSYPPVAVGAARVRETRRVTLAAGSPLLSLTSRFAVEGPAAGITVVAGLRTHKSGQTDSAPGLLLQWEPCDGADLGYAGLALLAAPDAAPAPAVPGHRLLRVGTLESGAAWRAGFSWSRHPDTPDFAAWRRVVERATRLGDR